MSSEANIWTPDDDPRTATLETHLYALGAGYVMRVHADITRLLDLPPAPTDEVRAAYHAGLLAKADDAAWSRAARMFARLIQGRKRGDDTATIYQRLVEAVVNKWLSEGRLARRASAAAVATYLLGQLKAGRVLEDPAASLRSTLDGVSDRYRVARAEYAAVHAAEHMQKLSDDLRHNVLGVVLTAEQNRDQPGKLATDLFHAFGSHARDWRRVALTETSTNRANGFIDGLNVGDRVRWDTAAEACPHCTKLDGRVFTVVDADDPDKDPELHVWVGKHQRGHRIGEHPAIPLHPHCRCSWTKLMAAAPAGVDPAIEAKLDALLEAARNP